MAWNTLTHIATRAALVVTAGFCMAPTCGNEITVSATDTSPPQVGFALDTGDGPEVVSGIVTLPRGTRYTVHLWGIDPESATSKIEYTASGSYQCCSDNGICGRASPLSQGLEQSQLTRIGSKAWSGLFDTFEGAFTTPRSCEGADEVSISSQYRVTARNGRGRETSGSFVIRSSWTVPTPPPAPIPGRECRSGERCCEQASGGGCLVCIPSNEQCR